MIENRNPGGQPGNINALKHGYYSKRVEILNVKDLEMLGVNLDDEIAALRIMSRKMFEYAMNAERKDDEIKGNLFVFGVSVMRIGHLLRIQQNLTRSGGGDIGSLLLRALEELKNE